MKMCKWVPLETIATIKQGTVLSSDKVWYLNLDEIEPNSGRVIRYSYKNSSSISQSTIAFDTSNVLYSKLRPYLNKVVVPKKEGYATSELLPLKPNPSRIMREYLAYFLRSSSFVKNISEKVAGAKMPRVVVSELNSSSIPLPTLKQQRDIVAMLDAVSELIQLRKDQLEKLNKLVESQFFEMFGDQMSNASIWLKVPLKELITNANNGLARRGSNKSGSIVLRLVELQSGLIDYSSPNRIILEYSEKKRYLLKNNDFLFCRVNGNPEYVGRCAVFKSIAEEVYHNDHIIRVHFDENRLNGSYASTLLNNSYGKQQLRKQIKTSAGQYTVSQDGIGSILMPLPPLKMQDQFSIFAGKVDELKLSIEQSLTELDTLMQSFSVQVFCEE